NGYKVVGVGRVVVCIEGVVSCGSVRWPSFGRAMVEELNELLEKLTFFEEESNRLFSFTRLSSNSKGYEAWEIGKDQEIEKYTLNLSPFWVRIYNIPFDQMDRQTVLELGKVIGEVMAIDWRDRNGGYIEYIRVKVKIDVLNLELLLQMWDHWP
ncbi:hypothetical protein Gotri_015987, partial [Gossypium trilobum]|nr:hypothetical protein [Gossypium trilobum]